VAAKELDGTNGRTRVWADFWGLILIGLAVVLFAALVSYDRLDLAFNTTEPNRSVHNLVGRVGAWFGYYLQLYVGVGAWIIPVLMAGFGIASFVKSLVYLRNWRSLVASVGLLVACIGVLAMCEKWIPGIGSRRDTGPGPGGTLGHLINDQGIEFAFGRVGAGFVYVVIYLLSLLFLTDYQLLSWVRSVFHREPKTPDEKLAAEQAALEKKAKALEKKSRELAKQESKPDAVPEPVAKAAKGPKTKPEPGTGPEAEAVPAGGVGADLKPFPEPTIRDHSVPQPREAQVMKPGDVIKADEIDETVPPAVPAAPEARPRKPRSVTESILGRDSELRKSGTDDAETVPVDAHVADPDADAPPWNTEPDGAGEAVTPLAPDDAPLPRPRVQLQPRRNKPITVASTPMIGDYRLPSMDLLNLPDLTVKPTETKEELMANARLMVQTLAQFGIEVAPGDITKGPTITRYELHPAPGVKLEKIAGLTNNIAAALKAERLNILAPVPGKSSVGVEVPNAVKTKVIMRDLLESPEWQNSKCRIPLALGKDVYGHPIIADLAEMPHVLIAGSTGSGKSVCINTIIASLLYKFTPDQLRFVMIDPKVVELQTYNALPHLVVPVVTDPKKVILALRWVVNEMEKRYQIFARVGVRNIKAFNERPKDKPLPVKDPELPLTAKREKVEPGADGFAVEVDEQIVVPRDEDIVIPENLSYIVVIIDELADLMLVAPADVEMAIARITQMARAAGIHCIVATQRPSVDVITGVIKANIPARIAFQVAAKVDSRTILDQMGADKLLGKGDMLYLPPGSGRLIRAQGALITDQEIEAVVGHISRQGKPSYEVEIHQALQKAPSSVGSMSLDPDDEGNSEDEDIIQKCIEVIRTEKKASVSLLQRRLKLGYGRASRMMDELEDRGIVGPSKGAEPRDILLDLDGGGYDGRGQGLA
jgi:DNA segregation ATPase FtsK/SpoIIIE, S-DNA-T family